MDRKEAINAVFVIEAFWPSRRFGGPIVNTYKLCSSLADRIKSLRVVSTTAGLPADGLLRADEWTRINGFDAFYGRTQIGLLSRSMAVELSRAVADASVVHVTGFYNWTLPYTLRLAEKSKTPVVCAPRGSLLPAARSNRKFRKVLFNKVFQRSVRSITAFHATSEEEAAVLRDLFPDQRVAVIANGVDVPDLGNDRRKHPRYFLYLGRLHEYKQVDSIIQAFAKSRSASQFVLKIVGEGLPGYVAKLKGIAHTAGVGDRVEFPGYADDERKRDLLANATALVLFSKSENFGAVIAESLAHGSAVIVTKNAPWKAVDQYGCGICVDPDEESLTEAFDRIGDASEQDIRAMGERGRCWMARQFSWDHAANLTVDLFRSLSPAAVA